MSQELIHSVGDGQQVYVWIIGILLSVIGVLYKENREHIKQRHLENLERIKRLEEKQDMR